MPNNLSRMKTKEVSMVDRGANRKVIAMRKSEDGNMDEIIKACLGTPMENEAAFDAAIQKAGANDKAQAALKAAARVFTAFKDQVTPEHFTAFAEKLGFKVEAPVAPAPAAAAVAKSEFGKCPKCGESLTQKSGSDAAIEEEMLKNLAPEVRAQLEKAEQVQKAQAERLEKAEKALAAELDARRTRECVEKAAKEFPHLGNAEEVGAVLKSVGEDKALLTVLRAANERAKAASIFEEKGRTVTKNGGDAFKSLAASAEEIRKADPKLSSAQAMDIALRNNPEAYNRYLDEQKEGR